MFVVGGLNLESNLRAVYILVAGQALVKRVSLRLSLGENSRRSS